MVSLVLINADMKNISLLFLAGMISTAGTLHSQAPTCDPNVPFYQVNLVGQPAGVWISPVHSRLGNCCSTTSPDRCTSFEILLDTGAAMISFEIASGSIPTGSMYYQIGCGPQQAVGDPICVIGPGPHYLTFCKPGNNTNTYRVTSIPKPTFPGDQTARFGCSLPLHVLGLLENSITWNSIFPGPSGAYNSYLNCTTACDSVLYTPPSNAPAFIDYVICGTPIATECGYVALCDTIRIFNSNFLTSTVTPNPATFCGGGPGVLLTAAASGGLAPYTFSWYNQSLNLVGTGSTFNVTSGGTYQLRVEDALFDSTYCPATLVSVPVTQVPPPTVSAGNDQTVCASDAATILQGVVTNATGGIWSGGAGTYNPSATSLLVTYTPTAAEILAGQVTLTLTSTGAGGGCINASDNITITIPPLLVASLSSQTITCNGGNATLTPVVSGGTSPYSYLWNTGLSSNSLTAGSGNYCVAITDNMGCNINVCANITEPPLLSSTVSSVDATTNGGTDGSASVVVTGGVGPYSYLWTPGSQTTATAIGLSYGVYSVVVTDANGCTTVGSVVVNEPRCLGFQVSALATNLSCNGDSTATATAIVSGGTAPYTFAWNTSPVQTTFLASNLSAGTYFVTVIESSGCIEVASAVVSEPPALINTINSTNTSAVAANDGSATANPSGGTAPYSYVWNTTATTQTISNLTAGLYLVTITDANGCSRLDSVRIYDPECASIVMNTYSTAVSCPGGSDGSASAQILFGIPPYIYSWSNGGTTPTISGLTAGTYTVIGSGALNCLHFANITVTQPAPFTAALSPTNVSCNNENDGTIELTVSGGTYPYTYSWSNGSQVEDLANLAPGIYTVTITDAHGCITMASTSITQPTPLVVTTSITDITCNGGSDGAIDVTVTGGATPYSYSWSNSATSQDLTGLLFGTYILTVTDANNCAQSNLALPVNEPSVVVIDSIIVACPVPGSGVAEVTVYPSGGNSGQYSISFDNGTTFLSAGVYTTFLPVGTTYYVVANDVAGCATTQADTLVIAPDVQILSVSFDPCVADGVTSIPVIVTVTGGSSTALMMSFDNGVTYLPAGTYNATLATGTTLLLIAQDSLACLSTTEIVVLPSELSMSTTTSTFIGGSQVSCASSMDGSIDLTSNGGTGNQTFSWSNGATTEDISGLAAGTYTVIVSDSMSCSDTISATLTAPMPLTSVASVSSNYNGFGISCAGATDGSVDLAVAGGTNGYAFAWSNGSTTEDLNNIPAGVYSVLVTDTNNCTTTDTIMVTEPTALTASVLSQRVYCNGDSTGGADLTANGGVTSYAYLWSTNATSEDISGVPAGNYTVVVTDANGCTTTSAVTVTQPLAIALNGAVSNLTCFNSDNGSVDLTTAGGIVPFTYLWSNAATTQDNSSLAAGSYSVIVTDSAGCTDTISFLVTQPDSLMAAAIAPTDFNGFDVSCAGSTNGAVDLTVTGGTSAYTYVWNNAASTEDLLNVGAGTYSVTITDVNGCQQTATVTLTEPPLLVLTSTQQNVPCNGFFTGSIDLTLSGGVPVYTYVWSNSATTQDIAAIGAGTYSVTVTDANGCTTDSVFQITELSPIISSTNVVNPLCYNSADGSGEIAVVGGTTPYSYAWSNGQTTEDPVNLSSGTYFVVITDSNNCQHTDTIILGNPNPLETSLSSPLQFNGHHITFFGGSDGSVDLEVTGGTPGYTYLWSNGSVTQDLGGIPAGTYAVTIFDANGCSIQDTITIHEPLDLEMPTGFSPNGDGQNDAFVVHGLESFPNNRMEVYNRWGNLVYDADGYMNGWRGTSDAGAELPDGTYFVILTINDGAIKLNGFVDLRR